MEQLLTVFTEDLRMAVLLIGVLLIVAIIVWEVVQRRRAKQADQEHIKGPLGQSREAGEGNTGSDPLFGTDAAARSIASSSSRTEPSLTLPEISTRDRLVEPPLVDLDVALRSSSEGRGLPVMQAAVAAETARDFSPIPPPDVSPERTGTAADVAAADIAESAAIEGSATAEAAVEPVAAATAPRLELPAEERRVIVALRVVARQGERFTGASLRQALQGEGFVHGDMAIFHRAVADGRVLLSAASLTKPGSFDLATMDSSLYLGINVFGVLPGPLPGRDTVDKLLLSGHTLAQRLRGELHDAKGQPLTEARLAEMRREAAAAG